MASGPAFAETLRDPGTPWAFVQVVCLGKFLRMLLRSDHFYLERKSENHPFLLPFVTLEILLGLSVWLQFFFLPCFQKSDLVS